MIQDIRALANVGRLNALRFANVSRHDVACCVNGICGFHSLHLSSFVSLVVLYPCRSSDIA